MNKLSLFGVPYARTDYSLATEAIIQNAQLRNSFGVTALAVHGLVESANNQGLAEKVRKIDLIVPDGMPVVWALNSIYGAKLKDRVCGPDLTLQVLSEAARKRLNVFLYGSTAETLARMQQFINREFEGLTICGIHVDRFRDATPEEDADDIRKINESGAHIVLVGRGCPRQEIWVSQHIGKVNAVMMAVGAAFDYYAGNLQRAPRWMQRNGLEWLYRLMQEPQRLWKRYLYTNSQFMMLFMKQKFGILKPSITQ